MPAPTPRLDPELLQQAARSCTASQLRRATRAVGRLYDAELRPQGLRGSQFSLLVALELAGEATLSRVSGLLGLDRTTLTRNLGPLERDGLVESAEGADARQRLLRLTPRGRARLARGLPAWQRAQERMVAALGEPRWRQLLDGLDAAAATGARSRRKGGGR